MVNKNYQTLDLGILHHCTDPKVESLVAGSSKVEEPELELICLGDHLAMRDEPPGGHGHYYQDKLY